MKKLSTAILANLITTNRKKLSMTQQSLADATGINRSLISRMEKEDFLPSIPQLEQLGEVLGFRAATRPGPPIATLSSKISPGRRGKIGRAHV